MADGQDLHLANPDSIESPGRLGRTFLYVTSALIVLTGPAIFLFLLDHPVGDGLVAVLVCGVVFTIVLVPLGIILGLNTSEEHRKARRLREHGIPASVEVLSVRVIPWDGETDHTEVGLRFRGAGFDRFDALLSRARVSDRFRVGNHVTALVDPHSHDYLLTGR